MKEIAGVPLLRRLETLYRFERSGMRLGLEGIERLLDDGGRPDRAFPSILIAGTNGKGSTAAHLASILRAAGLKTGLYTSPHLVRFNERIRVDGREIDDEALARLLASWWPRFETHHPSFFEAATALCFDHFAAASLDVAVVEVGLGGRLDATNVLSPRVSVITTIATDHTEILGRRLRQIAAEKAGIVRPGGALVLGVRAPEARDAILDVAAERGSRVLRLGREAQYAVRSIRPGGTAFRLRTPSFSGVATTPLLGAHQARNAALAALAAEAFLAGLEPGRVRDAIASGLAATRWPARAEWIEGDPPVLVDVAHNVEGAAALAATIEALLPGRKLAVVAAFSRDKPHEAMLRVLGRVASRFTLTEFEGERSTPAAVLAARAPARHLVCEAIPRPEEAIASALAWARGEGGALLVTGSFYLMPAALAALGREVPRAL
ncbi:MAG TPA: folylpolyglutamate synthase/dihydrofolate synthase family protein [Candidatus Eisenbacteria bacterium]